MRLGRILEIIEKNVDGLTVSHQAAGGNNVTMERVHELRSALIDLSEVSTFKERCNNLLGQIPIPGKDSKVTVVNTTLSSINTGVSSLKNTLVNLRNVLESVVEKPKKGQIFLKLPKKESLSELIKVIDRFNKAMDQVLCLYDERPQLKLSGFDTGTEWLVLHVPPETLAMILPVFWASLKIAKEKLQFDLKYQEYEERKAEKETRDKFRDTINMLMDDYIGEQSKNLITLYKKDPKDPKHHEDFKRITNGLKD